MSNTITIDRDFFGHLLNCMANQKALPTLDVPMSDREKEYQETIDKAYHRARELLSQPSIGQPRPLTTTVRWTDCNEEEHSISTTDADEVSVRCLLLLVKQVKGEVLKISVEHR